MGGQRPAGRELTRITTHDQPALRSKRIDRLQLDPIDRLLAS